MINQTFTKHSVSFSLEKLLRISVAQTKHGELGEALVAVPKRLLTHIKKKKKWNSSSCSFAEVKLSSDPRSQD